MQIRFHCPHDGCVAIIEYEPLEKCNGTITCPRCREPVNLDLSESVRNRHTVDRCALCGCRELFIRKDFPQRLGLLIVVVFGLWAIYYFSKDIRIALAILAGAVVLDLVIYLFLRRLTACYACRAEYRKCPLNPAHEGFELSTSEKY